jgi:hypothetical protein
MHEVLPEYSNYLSDSVKIEPQRIFFVKDGVVRPKALRTSV